MLIERFYDDDLAQASYLIGCQQTGEAVVVDARRDVGVYLSFAEANNMKIVAVTETHIHADYLSGTRELAAATDSTMYVSGEGGADWQYQFDAERIFDGHAIDIGNISLQAIHTPGHTPEHLAFLITDKAFSMNPGYLLSGDFVFSGDLGRPDLLDEAAGGVDTRFEAAKQMFVSIREKLLTLPDYVQILPGHGAGSACGKSLGALPSTTVGYERLNAWWSAYLIADDEDGFIREFLDGQPDAPFYFGRMKKQNQLGPTVLGSRLPMRQLDGVAVSKQLAADTATFVDTRSAALVHQGTVSGAVNIPFGKGMAGYAAWVIDPELDVRPLVLLAADVAQAREISDHLLRVGIDNVAGFVKGIEHFPVVKPRTISPLELASCEMSLLLDVRTTNEHIAGSIPGSVHVHGGRVLWNTDQLPSEGTIVTYCRSGARSSVVSSALRRNGYEVVELQGSFDAWAATSE